MVVKSAKGLSAAAVLACAAVLSFSPAPDAALAAPPAPDPALTKAFGSDIRPFLEANCFSCHGNGKHKGDVTLDGVTSFESVRTYRQTWEDVAEQLRTHQMPPKKAQQQPAADQVEKVLKWSDQTFDFLDRTMPHDPGFVPIHRLNRTEYNNTIRDLVGVDFKPAADFPGDDTGYGFDNIADVLSISPLLAEKYLAAAEAAMSKAIPLDDPYRFVVAKLEGESLRGDGSPGSEGQRLLFTSGTIHARYKFVAPADYELVVNAEADQAGPELAKMRVGVDGKEIKVIDVDAVHGSPHNYTVRTHVPAGEHRIEVSFMNDYYNGDAPDPKDRGDRNLYVDFIQVRGPIDPPAPPGPSDVQKQLLFCGPADGAQGEQFATEILKRFAVRAYRRPVSPEEVARLVKLYQHGRSQGDSFEKSCRLALTAVLVSPQFLYRIETDPAAQPELAHPVSDYELATRLSYFLWSSTPDDQLTQAAAAGNLHNPDVLRSQVRRMLADPRSVAFVENFAGQWLELRNLDGFSPDPRRFPKFDRKLLKSMRREAELFFANILHENGSILDLINANYTFLDEPLAKFYGVPNVTGPDFRRVNLEGDVAARRGGVLTMASVLTVTAMPGRTSPPKRGKFILDQILGTPPPPPPPNVPSLKDKGREASNMSVRQRLEQHRADATCASCHARIDPIGFALENFNAIGQWRERDGDFPVDSSGVLPSGEAINGSSGLKQVILNHKEQFDRALVEKMMTYALGRGTTVADRPVVADICRTVEQNGFKLQTLIEAVATSDAFMQRRGKEAGKAQAAAR